MLPRLMLAKNTFITAYPTIIIMRIARSGPNIIAPMVFRQASAREPPSGLMLGLGIMLAAGEIPRIAGMFGLETSVRPNINGVINTAQSAVHLKQIFGSY